MNARRLRRQVGAEQRVYWRNLPTAFFTFFLPLLFLVFLGVFGKDKTVNGHPYAYLFVPGMLGTATVMTTYAGLAITLTIRRDRGMLKRVRGTPLPPSEYLAGLVLSTSLVLALESVVVLLVGHLAFDVALPTAWPELVGLVVLGAACFAGLGIATTRIVPSAEGSSAVVNAIYVPVLVLSGAFFPVSGMPTVLRWISDALPLSHLLSAMQAVFIDGGMGRDELLGLLVVVAWGIAGAVLALRTFNWEPRGG
jgi:ABC-2 type transport system permease protein